MATFNATFQTSENIKVSFSQSESLNASFKNVIKKYPEDADMEAKDLRFGKKGYGKDGEIIGTLPDNGDVSAEIRYAPHTINIPAGITTGGQVRISSEEQAKIIRSNIKDGVTILGVTGLPTIKDVSDTTATRADVARGREFYLADGSPAVGSYVWNWMGEHAEKIADVHSLDAALKDTAYNGWTPSTTAITIVPSENKTAVAIDTGSYEYLIRWLFTADITYTEGVTMKAVPIRQAIELWQSIIKRPSSWANAQIPTYTANSCVTFFTAPVIDYYNTSGTRTFSYTGSYGFYIGAVAATFSSSTSDTPNLTIKTPTISARCNSSYFATARGAYVDQENSNVKLRGELWRMDIGSATRKMFDSVVNLYNNPLT